MASKKASQTLGDRLRSAREKSGLSAKQVADRLGVKPQSVSAWEHDQREPRANKLHMLAGILNVSMTWLLEGSGKGPKVRSVELELEELSTQITALCGQLQQASRDLEVTRRKVSALLNRVRAEREKAS
jgi:transcriptional regulator with XRE-family HTH domain